jgi:hypothetical protein
MLLENAAFRNELHGMRHRGSGMRLRLCRMASGAFTLGP